MGAPTACETAGVPNVSYNGSTVSACPNTFIVSSRVNWAPYYEYAIKAVMNGDKIDADWTGTLATNSVLLTDVNEKAAAPDSYKADVDTDDKYTPDTEVIKDGAFKESKFRSAPYFDVKIDGIKLLNEKM